MNKKRLKPDPALMQVYHYIRQKELILPGTRVLAAVSGGADSVCLFLMLHELKDLIPFELEIVTVDHGIRGESSEQDVSFVRELAERYHTPVTCHYVDVPAYAQGEKLSVEEAARKLRYACILETKKERQADYVATGHHLEDQAETVLHNLFRGSGLSGLSGIPAKTEDERGLIRPLLGLSRSQIEAYLERKGQGYRTDETNLTDDYTRNRLRHQVLPLVTETINKEAVRHVALAGELIAEASEVFEALTDDFIARHVKRVDPKTGRPHLKDREKDNSGLAYRIPLSELTPVKPVLRREIYHKLAGNLSDFGYAKNVERVHLFAIDEIAFGPVSGTTRLPGHVLARKGYECLFLLHEEEPVKTAEKEELKSAAMAEQRSAVMAGRRSAAMAEQQSAEMAEQQSAVMAEQQSAEMADYVDLPLINEFDEDGPSSFPFTFIRQERALAGFLTDARILSVSKANFTENNYTKCFDYDKIKNGLSLRTRQAGDYFYLEKGGKKSLKSYFIDKKIPAGKRDLIPLLADRDHILLSGDGRISAYYKVGEDTRHVLQIKISSPEGIKEYCHE